MWYICQKLSVMGKFLYIFITLLLFETASARDFKGYLPDIPKFTSEVWDFSNAETIGRPAATYVCYGDTLVSEEILGRTYWHKVDGDTSFLIQEDTQLLRLKFTGPLVSGFATHTATGYETDYTARGKYSRTFKVAEQGSQHVSAVRRGIVITPSGDSIPAIAVAETRRYLASLSPEERDFPLDADMDSLDRFETTVYRWFVPGDRLPVAVGMETRSFEYGGETSQETKGCLVYLDGTAKGSESECYVWSIMTESVLTLVAQIESGTSVTGTVTVITDDGLPHLSETVVLADGESRDIDLRSLPYGRYVVTSRFCGKETTFYIKSE